MVSFEQWKDYSRSEKDLTQETSDTMSVIEQRGILPSIQGGIINLFKTILLT